MRTPQYSAHGKWRGGYNSPEAPQLTIEPGVQKISGIVCAIKNGRVTISNRRFRYNGVWPDPNVQAGDYVTARCRVTVKSETFGFINEVEIVQS